MPVKPLLVDSSFLFALYNPQDPDHSRSLALVQRDKRPRLIPNVVLTEVAYLMRRAAGVSGATLFLSSLARAKPTLVSVTISDLERASQIMRAYASADFDFVDCCVMVLAERLEITTVLTYDRRDFSIFRPTHCDYLELLP
jgi:uncharacterized protein